MAGGTDDGRAAIAIPVPSDINGANDIRIVVGEQTRFGADPKSMKKCTVGQKLIEFQSHGSAVVLESDFGGAKVTQHRFKKVLFGSPQVRPGKSSPLRLGGGGAAPIRAALSGGGATCVVDGITYEVWEGPKLELTPTD